METSLRSRHLVPSPCRPRVRAPRWNGAGKTTTMARITVGPINRRIGADWGYGSTEPARRPLEDRPAATSMAVPSYSHPEHVTSNKGVWMSPQPGVPVLRQVVLDTTDVRALAEFYRRLLDLHYRPGDEHPGADAPDPRGQDWLAGRSAHAG